MDDVITKMFAPGVRVVRGPDWNWKNQDGGEGHVGTVCEIGRFGSLHSPEKTVVVNWDSGHRTNYRVGYQGQYDLTIVDNAQIGVKHPNIICDGCSKAGIAGIRFRCAQCTNYDLCATCYGADIHDLEHPFIRYQTTNSVGVRVPTRKSSTRIQLKGIFVGAKVVRGPDWEWGQQDGGDGKTGRVMEIRGWDNESCRSVANVSWVSGSTNVYRLGHKGNVDLKYIQPAGGGYYYRDHMPVLGQAEEQQPIVQASRPNYSVGDRVKVCLDKEALVKLQQGHGGWNPRMAEYLTKIGTVHRITDKGDIRVQYEGCANRWTFHPAALVKVCTFQVGDLVTIINDAAKVQKHLLNQFYFSQILQKGHGEWVETMRNALNKSAKVIKVYADGDLRIQQIEDGFAWTLNPKCVKLERSPLAAATERSNSMMDLSHQRADHVMMPLSGLSGSSAADKLVREAAQGRVDYVQHYLGQYPEQVDVMSAGKTCLQVSAHQGHIQLVKFLLTLGANVNAVDKEGDSTLHYAAFGNQPEVMRVLLMNGADINILNSSHCSALHISAHKKPPQCVKILLEHGADVNMQDSYGDTALHDAIGKENFEVVDLLCSAPNLDLTVRNNRGFNVLHHSSLKGNSIAIKRLLQLARQLVDVKKDDGFAALHLAALNGHANVVEVLVKDGQADINIRNNRRQTPFLLAVSQGHAAAIEKLVDLGCDILAKDEDGDNAMHLCVIKKSNLIQEVPKEEAPQIWTIYQSLQHITENRLMCAILCYLAKNGCTIDANNKGKRILDWVCDKPVQDLILSYVNKSGASVSGEPSSSTVETGDINIATINLTESGTGSNSSSANTSMLDPEQLPSSSNPPTPLRRHHQANSRDVSTPPPSNPFIQYVLDEATNASTKPKKTDVDRTHTLSPPLPTEAPTTSNQMNDMNFTENELTRSNLSPQRGVKDAPSHDSNQPAECIVCNEVLPLTIFEPCSHQISCEECSVRMKKCLSCGTVIEKRITPSGVPVVPPQQQQRQLSSERLRYLENKILEIEETHSCSICMERRRNVAFLCGHGACSKCSETLKTCHMCRKTIIKKINLY
ncbi:E3 ubiquitin-protein ligase MIB2 [Pseudolycoriella hygida]|uniref:RING-type E3 ubiquitin transferase n=1 Tax=Pseudolycoriella hygida TaxID=35572 RepID=A0A9Q0S7U1_9DIPT|nr:E3 ubiquitin-protein ligase MIB2 [Pseudolycoriella hygida]